MNLSNRLTFSLVFSVLLVAGFALVPTVMAAEGGPTVESIDVDTTPLPDDSDTATDESVVKDGVILLTTGDSANRVLAVGSSGEFRVIVTFSEDVYQSETVTDQPETPGSNDVPAELFGTADISVFEITSTGLVASSVSVSEGTIARYVTSAADATVTTYSRNKFIVPISVSGTTGNLPIAVFLRVKADAVYGKGTAADIPNDIDQAPGIGNQQSARERFNIDETFPAKPTVGGSSSTASIAIHETLTVTLTFTEAFDPPLTAEGIRGNINVVNGTIKSDDTTTPDVDEGVGISDDNLVWTLTIIPAGGVSQNYTLTVENVDGAPFVFSQDYQVDSRPPELQITFSGTPVKGGTVFTVTITYGVAPTTALTEAGVTVTGGTIVAGTFSGRGTTYMLDVDPTDTVAGTDGTLTIRVGQDSHPFTIPAPDAEEEIPDDDPNAPVSISLDAGLGAKEYLVITPAMIATDVDESVNVDVLPAVLTARETQATMPNLEDLLFSGGTIDVYVVATDTPDIIISEVMWAVDEAEVGTEGYTAHQWIELYNNSDNDAAVNTITLWFKPRTLSGAPTDKGTRTDRLSNVLRFGTTTGWRLGDNHGQNGNSNPEAPEEFISMFRKGDKLGDNDGINGAHWLESTDLSHVNHRGTPGAANTRSQAPVATRPAPSVFNPSKSNVIINEVYNDADNKFDWIELRFLKKTNLENWTLSYTRSNFTEHEIMRFPKREFAEGTILLIVNANPRDTNLAAGQDVTEAAENQARGAGPHKYWNPSNGNSSSNHYLDIPKKAGGDPDGDFLLILRTGKGWERFGSRDRIHDVVGTGTHERKTLNSNTVAREPNTENPNDGKKGYIWNTRVWPLNGHHDIRNAHKDHAYSLLDNRRNLAEGKVWRRNGTNQGWQRDGGNHIGFQGGLGYDRGFKGNGSPGYENSPVKGRTTELDGGRLVISELMLTTDNGRFPQYIELHNTSKTKVVNLASDGSDPKNGWQMIVENHNSGSWKDKNRPLTITFNLKDGDADLILPNQTILIVADKVRHSKTSAGVTHFPDYRVISVWEKARSKFKMANRRDAFLNAEGGFYIKIVDGDGRVADEIGNLDGKAASVRNDIPLDDPYSWNWPAEMVDNRRTSLIRIRDEDASGENVPRAGIPDRSVAGDMTGAVIPMGIRWRGAGKTGTGEAMLYYAKYAKHAWVHASDTKMANAQITWYGSDSDYGTPGHTTSTPLPVSLSYFRPTLENGEVVIRWTTQSELDNAGFNILRSDSRNGEFKQVNSELVQGAGTTGERNTYKWVDESAKPGVVYYYQIEDVSFAGERQTLTTTKLKGLISADNKLTTLWGGLKSQQD